MPMRRAGALLRERKAEFGRLLVEEMGKPLAQAEAEVEKCAGACDWYADEAGNLLADQRRRAWDPAEPGPVHARWASCSRSCPGTSRSGRCSAPARRSSGRQRRSCSSTRRTCRARALAIESLFGRRRLPGGPVRDAARRGRRGRGTILRTTAIAARHADRASAVGARVASIAARSLKKQVLELGGSDPFIVLADADVPTRRRPRPGRARSTTARAASRPSGSSSSSRSQTSSRGCSRRRWARSRSGTRWTARHRSGRSRARTCSTSWIARSSGRRGRARPHRREAAHGTGSTTPRPSDRRTPGMTAFDEETFGPAAAIVRARDASHAVELANASVYGLGATVWSRDLARAEAVGRQLEAGLVFVNGIVKSDRAAAVRRREAERLRPRAGLVRAAGVQQHPDVPGLGVGHPPDLRPAATPPPVHLAEGDQAGEQSGSNDGHDQRGLGGRRPDGRRLRVPSSARMAASNVRSESTRAGTPALPRSPAFASNDHAGWIVCP